MGSGYEKSRYGMVIDIDRCTGCGACTLACAAENNVAPTPVAAGERKGVAWLRVHRVAPPAGERGGAAFIPIMCQHCGHETPCVGVCPQNAVQVDAKSGIVAQIPVRCLGCRYCMAACPFHARAFNWWDPAWPDGMEATLNPDVSTRTRGVVEKCNLCHARLQAARARAASAGRRALVPADGYVPACVEACPSGAIVFGDLDERDGEAAREARRPEALRLLASLGFDTKVYYRTTRAWVRRLAESVAGASGERRSHA